MCCTLSGMLALLNPVEPALDELFDLLKSLHAPLRAPDFEQVIKTTRGQVIGLPSNPLIKNPCQHGPALVHCLPSQRLIAFPRGQRSHSTPPPGIGCPGGPQSTGCCGCCGGLRSEFCWRSGTRPATTCSCNICCNAICAICCSTTSRGSSKRSTFLTSNDWISIFVNS